MKLYSDVWKRWMPPTEPIWAPEHALAQGHIGVYGVLDGNNSAGKSTLFEHLQQCEQIEKLKMMLAPGERLVILEEPVKARVAEIEEWYKSLGPMADQKQKSDIIFEFAAYQWRVQQQQKKLKNFCGIAIGERHPYVGSAYYLPALYAQGKVTEEDFFNYMAITGQISVNIAWPQIWQTLHTDAPVCRTRVLRDDNRKTLEKEFLTEQYLGALEDEIVGPSTLRMIRYCQRNGIPRPQIPRFDTTKGVERDKTARVRATNDLFERIVTIVQEQREEIERRRQQERNGKRRKKR